MEQLIKSLNQLEAARIWGDSSYRSEGWAHGAVQTQTVASQYYWDGLRRGGDPEHPYIVFQYTLEGWGCYETEGVAHRVTPGMAFAAVVPSPDRYYLPPSSPGWTFFFVIVHHPYVVRRIIEAQAKSGPLFVLPPEEMLFVRTMQLFEGLCQGSFRDRFAEEHALFEFLVEYDRFAHRKRYPEEERQRLLHDVRLHTLKALRRPLDVAELGGLFGMSRSHFSHYFKANTGLSPAVYVTQIRLEEAVQRLLRTDMRLREIAEETGFANANHLCKVFRRHFFVSPDVFRRQMRSGGQGLGDIGRIPVNGL